MNICGDGVFKLSHNAKKSIMGEAMKIDAEIASVVLLAFTYLIGNIVLIVGAVVAIDSPYILPSCRDRRKRVRERQHA